MGNPLKPSILREIARRCRANEPLQDLGFVLGTALEEFLGRRQPTIESALGISSMRGGISWLTAEANWARDNALRNLAEIACKGQSVAAQARSIYLLSIRYAASAWPRDRDRPAAPEKYAGTIHGWLWQAFKSGARMPVGERQLRNILRR